MDKMKFRNEEVSYMYGWLDADTFGFDFGDGEFTDPDGLNYFIRFEYHTKNKEWIVEIWWEDDSICINKLNKINADKYITVHEIEKVKTFIKQFMD